MEGQQAQVLAFPRLALSTWALGAGTLDGVPGAKEREKDVHL